MTKVKRIMVVVMTMLVMASFAVGCTTKTGNIEAENATPAPTEEKMDLRSRV